MRSLLKLLRACTTGTILVQAGCVVKFAISRRKTNHTRVSLAVVFGFVAAVGGNGRRKLDPKLVALRVEMEDQEYLPLPCLGILPSEICMQPLATTMPSASLQNIG
mmetsp:Transcript_129017/g.251230  ORF Transcript_129017/g.251230 Transcript_129017/m.251230 type:complete len:106 (+) Transcript_129017:482-799(+)